MTFCATCGRPRTGTAQRCAGCGAQFSDVSGDRAAPGQTSGGGPPARSAGRSQGADPTRWDTGWYRPEPGTPGTPGAPGPPGPPGPQPPSPRRGRPGILIAAIAVLVLAVGAGAFAIVSALTGHSNNAAQQPSQAASSATATPTAVSSATGTAGPSSPTAGTTPTGQAGTSTVAVSAAAAGNAAAPRVQALLERYFAAINAHDFAAYSSLLDAQMRGNNTPSSFASGYATTTDSAETLTAISDTGGGSLAATVSFTSHQNPADSINNSSCTAWTITLYLQPGGGSYLIGAPPPGYQPTHQNCP